MPRKRNATFSDEAISTGLRPEDVLVYVERAQGRGNRPYQKDEYRWAKKRRTLTRHEATRTKKYHTAFHITVQQLLIRLTDYDCLLTAIGDYKIILL